MTDGGFSSPKEEDEEEPQFFDARDDISSASESSPSSPSPCQRAIPTMDFLHGVFRDLQPGFLAGSLESVEERRQRFMAWMRLNSMFSPRPCSSADQGTPAQEEEAAEGGERIATGISELDGGDADLPGLCRITNLDDGRVFVVDRLGHDGALSGLREVSSDRVLTADEFRREFAPSSFVRRLMRREDNMSTSSTASTKRRRSRWLRRLGIAACIMDREEEEPSVSSRSSEVDASPKDRVRRLKVRAYRKPSKEFSGVYTGQEIRAHKGAILAMKFSPDGRYLATGGEDGVVRVWAVAAQERTQEDDLPKDDPSSIYFSVNQNSELTPICTGKEEKLGPVKGLRRTTDAACIVIPTEVCRISEEPLHEFLGHSGDILDLSWSKNNHLLSSSTDKTARLWKVGSDSFGKVFSHGNYVTCVQFNPNDEGYFISGSIDGKVRIWEISSRHVVEWIDVREIVTAVCFDPNRKGIVVGTISGRCLFYDSSDRRLQLVSVVPLQGKKKSACNRITGFQFCPSDSRKLLVTSADSQVRILEEFGVVCKFKGLRNSGSQISASFTADGRYVVSGSEDSNVYVWNCGEEEDRRPCRTRSAGCYERFPSTSASVAVPWPGEELSRLAAAESRNLARQMEILQYIAAVAGGRSGLYLSASGGLTPGQSFFSDFLLTKGSATWPEEKLLPPSRSPAGPVPGSPQAGRARPNILVTGTPGTGKTTTSSLVAEATQLRHINVGELVKQKGLHDGWDEELECHIINEDLVCDELEDIMEEGGNIVDYHGCDFFPERWFDCVVVLQTDNSILYDRLSCRGYTGLKLTNNIECEIFQVLLEEAKGSYRGDIVMAMRSDSVDDISRNVSTLTRWVSDWASARLSS